MRKPKPTIRTLLSIALTLACGCAGQPPPDPALYSVCMSAGEPCASEGYAGEWIEVALNGEHFHPAFEVDLGTSGPPPVRGEYQASIAGTPLDDVRRVTDALLLGTIPGTVPLGSHDVIVEIPGGRRAGLPKAFRLVDPLSVLMEPEHPRVPEGHAFGLDITLQNDGTALLTQITLRLSQEGAGRLQLPPDSVLGSLAGESFVTTTLQVRAQQTGSASLLIEVSALAGGSVPVGTRQPLATGILVLPPASLIVSADVSPPAVDPGDRFELITTVFNPGGTQALDVEVLAPTVSGSGSALLDDPAPTGVNIPAGSVLTIPWGGQALSPGTVVFEARVQGLEAVSGRLLGPLDAESVRLEIR